MYLKLLERKLSMYVCSIAYLSHLMILIFFPKVINEAHPDLKETRRLLSKQNRPTLTEVNSIVSLS